MIKSTIKTITQDYLSKYRVSDQDAQEGNNTFNPQPGHINEATGDFERAAKFILPTTS